MTIPCKICNSPAEHFFTCDFNANCTIKQGFWASTIKPCGVQVPHYRCTTCGFLFTDFMDDWSKEDFAHRIYNKDYPKLDGGYYGSRAGGMADILSNGLPSLKYLSVLDYGSGAGIQEMILKKIGCKYARSYDPFSHDFRPPGKFDVITAAEILEHSTTPQKTVRDILSFLKDDGLLIVTTLLQPDDIEKQQDKWWYAVPRVSHCSFYTKEALVKLYDGYSICFMGDNSHIVYKRWPDFAATLLPGDFAK